MTNQEKNVLLEQLAENEAFLSAFAKVESKDQLQELLKNNGLELTCEEVDAFVAKLDEAVGGELNEENLDDVAGGLAITAGTIFTVSYKAIKKVGKVAWKLGKKLANWEDNGYKKKK